MLCRWSVLLFDSVLSSSGFIEESEIMTHNLDIVEVILRVPQQPSHNTNKKPSQNSHSKSNSKNREVINRSSVVRNSHIEFIRSDSNTFISSKKHRSNNQTSQKRVDKNRTNQPQLIISAILVQFRMNHSQP